MLDFLSRSRMLIGEEAVEKLNNSKVVIFGIGGVGSFVAEGLARAGIGKLVFVDNDVISLSNINRQIHANYSTIGESKVETMKKRALEINPKLVVECHQELYLPESKLELIDNSVDYVADCVDMVTAKIAIIEESKKNNVPVISAMGTGNKLDPTMFEVADIYKTSVCPLAKVMRKELRKRNIEGVKVVYSKEIPIVPIEKFNLESSENNKRTPGSMSFVPSVAGMIIAGEIVKDLIKK